MAKKISKKGSKAIHNLLKNAKGYNQQTVNDQIKQANRT